MEEYTLDDYINLLALKNQLINAKLSTLMKDYKEDYLLYLQFLESVYMLLETDSGFLLFSEEAKEKIYSIIDIHRFDDDKEVSACVNEIIGYLNAMNGYSPEMKKLMKEQYLAYQEDIRQINILNGETLIDLMAYDALCLFSLNTQDEFNIKPNEEYSFLSSLNYLIGTCPEIFNDPDIKKNAEKAIDIIMKKGGFFNFKGKKYSKKTQANFQKIKTINERKED